MEMEQLLNAIMEVSQSVARLPCPPESKSEVLDNIRTLFSCYKGISSLLASYSSKREQTDRFKVVDESFSQSDKVWSSFPADITNQLCSNRKMMKNIEGKLLSLEQKLSSDYEKSYQDTKHSITDLKSGLATSISSVDQLKSMQYIIGNRVAVIENKSNDLELLKTQVTRLTSAADNCEGASPKAASQEEVLVLQLQISYLKKEFQASKDSKKILAFAAKSVGSTRFKAGETVQFKNVQFNINNCFDPGESIFRNNTCPGLYYFSSSINTDSDGVFELAIVHNGDEVNYFAASGKKDSQTGSSVLLYLQPGDTVCVKVAQQLIRIANFPGVKISSCFSNFIGYKID